MKPINLNKETCNPISSNCVVWQGPNIPCIQICHGDSVSDVVAKLATELCTVLDTLNVENYDLTCFNITACGPQDFQQLIQFLIDQICQSQEVTPVVPVKGGGCPDCLVTVDKCFSTEFPSGVAQLTDYVSAIAAKICTFILQISALQNSIVDLDSRVTVLEGYFPLPSPTETEIVPAACLGLPLINTPVSTVVTTLGTEFCNLIGATGTASEIVAAYISQCVNNTDVALATQYSAPGTQMGTLYPTYVTTPASLADAITNLWLAVCDVRSAGHKEAVVLAGSNTTVSSVTSVVGIDEVTTYTINSDANPLEVKNEGTSLTPNASSMNFVGDLVTATNSGTDTTVTINSFGGMRAQDIPTALNSKAFAYGTQLCFEPVQVISQIYDDDGAYDPLTGIWTCPVTGRYNLSCFAHYTVDVISHVNGWYDPGNPGGMFGVGVFASTGCGYYCANWMTVMGIQPHIDITAQAIGINITAGTQLSVKVLNQTGINYVPYTGDVIRFTVERIK